MNNNQAKGRPTNEEVLAGVRRAIEKVVEQAKRNNEELVIARDGKTMRIKAHDL